ncbi:MAG: hypothetical protein HY040_26055 [Planctomycetes bacterium]|nr:hypothetical protein [Planctomycetota bacterium]
MRFINWLGVAILGTAFACPVHGWWQQVDEQRRAGYPLEQSRLAHPSENAHQVGYYVGGGAAAYRHSDGPLLDEGTWGYDYQGWLIKRRVILNWWHGRRYQGGVGAYKTDGPRLKEVERGH